MNALPGKRYDRVCVLLGLLVLLPGVGVAWLHTQHARLQQQQLPLTQQGQRLQARLGEIRQHRQVLRAYTHWTPWLAKTLMLPRPDTDRWDARLFAIQQQYQLAEVHYSLPSLQACTAIHWPPQACTSVAPQPQDTVPLLAVTGMQLTLTQPHEAALLDWLQALQQAYPSAFLLKKCEWLLTEDGAAIKASCWLDWFHLARVLPEKTWSE